MTEPSYVGWFEDGVDASTFRVEMLVIERRDSLEKAWAPAAALIREPDSDARWVEGYVDESWSADPPVLWDYFVDKGGGNGYSYEIAFIRMLDVDDAPAVIEHLGQRLLEAHASLDPTTAESEVVHVPSDQAEIHVEDTYEEPEPYDDPCATHTHVSVPLRAADALTWQVAVQLVRRHPADLWIIRTYPFDGFYDCLSIRRFPDVLNSRSVSFNRNGTHVKVGKPLSDAGDEDEPLMSWGDPLESGDPAPWIRELEETAGLEAPKGGLPPSTRSSLALRWLAQFMSLTLGTREYWTAWNDWNEIDWGQPTQDLAAVPGAAQWVRERGDGRAAALVWLIGVQTGHVREPRAAISSDGLLWVGDAPSVDIAVAYRAAGSSLPRLVVETAAPLLAN